MSGNKQSKSISLFLSPKASNSIFPEFIHRVKDVGDVEDERKIFAGEYRNDETLDIEKYDKMVSQTFNEDWTKLAEDTMTNHILGALKKKFEILATSALIASSISLLVICVYYNFEKKNAIRRYYHNGKITWESFLPLALFNNFTSFATASLLSVHFQKILFPRTPLSICFSVLFFFFCLLLWEFLVQYILFQYEIDQSNYYFVIIFILPIIFSYYLVPIFTSYRDKTQGRIFSDSNHPKIQEVVVHIDENSCKIKQENNFTDDRNSGIYCQKQLKIQSLSPMATPKAIQVENCLNRLPNLQVPNSLGNLPVFSNVQFNLSHSRIAAASANDHDNDETPLKLLPSITGNGKSVNFNSDPSISKSTSNSKSSPKSASTLSNRNSNNNSKNNAKNNNNDNCKDEIQNSNNLIGEGKDDSSSSDKFSDEDEKNNEKVEEKEGEEREEEEEEEEEPDSWITTQLHKYWDHRIDLQLVLFFFMLSIGGLTYMWIMPLLYINAPSDFIRLILRVVVHPFIVEGVLLSGRALCRSLRTSGADENAVYLLLFFPVLTSSLYGRFLVCSIHTVEYQIITTVLLGFEDLTLRSTTSWRDFWLVYYPFYGKKKALKKLLPDLYTVFRDQTVMQFEVCELIGIISMPFFFQILQMSVSDHSNVIKIQSLQDSLIVMSIALVMEICTDSVAAMMSFITGHNIFRKVRNQISEKVGLGNRNTLASYVSNLAELPIEANLKTSSSWMDSARIHDDVNGTNSSSYQNHDSNSNTKESQISVTIIDLNTSKQQQEDNHNRESNGKDILMENGILPDLSFFDRLRYDMYLHQLKMIHCTNFGVSRWKKYFFYCTSAVCAIMFITDAYINRYYCMHMTITPSGERIFYSVQEQCLY